MDILNWKSLGAPPRSSANPTALYDHARGAGAIWDHCFRLGMVAAITATVSGIFASWT